MADDQFATAFADVAEAYDRGRPGYSPEAVDSLVRELGLKPSSVVIDLAAGTGKLTADLTRRFTRVIAIEPLAEMRAHIAQTAPAAQTLDATAERMPVPDGSANAVFVGQAFHWFDGRRALDEIARVLGIGAGLGLLWNTTPWERRETAWFALLDDLVGQSGADLSVMHRHDSGRWRDAFDHQRRFARLSEAVFDNTQRMSREEFLANLTSRSYVARLDRDARDHLLGETEALLRRDDAPVDGSSVVVPMRTHIYWTQLTG